MFSRICRRAVVTSRYTSSKVLFRSFTSKINWHNKQNNFNHKPNCTLQQQQNLRDHLIQISNAQKIERNNEVDTLYNDVVNKLKSAHNPDRKPIEIVYDKEPDCKISDEIAKGVIAKLQKENIEAKIVRRSYDYRYDEFVFICEI